MFFGFMFFTKF